MFYRISSGIFDDFFLVVVEGGGAEGVRNIKEKFDLIVLREDLITWAIRGPTILNKKKIKIKLWKKILHMISAEEHDYMDIVQDLCSYVYKYHEYL